MSKARIVLPIEGMSCASCAATVQEALGSASGVVAATVNYATGKAAVDYDDAQTHVAELIKTVRAAGYDCGADGLDQLGDVRLRVVVVHGRLAGGVVHGRGHDARGAPQRLLHRRGAGGAAHAFDREDDTRLTHGTCAARRTAAGRRWRAPPRASPSACSSRSETGTRLPPPA